MQIFTKKSKGFTLIELLVVIAIIGILATIVLVSLNDARQKARDTKRIGDLRQAQVALEIFFDDNQGYPTVATAGTCEDVSETADTVFVDIGLTGVNDPLAGQSYAYGANGTAGITNDDATDYVLKADLEDGGHVALNSSFDGGATAEFGCTCDAAAGEYCVKP